MATAYKIDAAATGIDGYVDDEVYPSGFDPYFAPAWTDAVLLGRGRPAPRTPRRAFTYVDLGCGDGTGLVLLAAAYPEAEFIGIDALESHIARGVVLAGRIGLTNVRFRRATFEWVDGLADDSADYVALRGVVSWVSAAAASAALDLAARLLRPGGALTVGYNVLPAWSPLLGFQRLVFDRAATLPGSGAQRFAAAAAQLRDTGLIAPAVLAWLDGKSRTLPPGYFAHEYLNRHWAPVWSGDLIDRLARRGLGFIGGAEPERQRPEFQLRTAQREVLAGMAGVAEREIATDIFVNQCFRTDIFVKGDAAVSLPEQRLRQVWAGQARAGTALYEIATKIGHVRFDNEAARAMLRHLEAGPDRLDGIAGLAPADLLNTLDALWLAGLVAPAEPAAIVPLAGTTNREVAAATLDHVVTPFGVQPGAA